MQVENFWFFVLVYEVHPDTFCTNVMGRIEKFCLSPSAMVLAGKCRDDKRDDFFL